MGNCATVLEPPPPLPAAGGGRHALSPDRAEAGVGRGGGDAATSGNAQERALAALRDKYAKGDTSGDGTISYQEFIKALRIPDDFLSTRLFRLFDEDGDGGISLEELLNALATYTKDDSKRVSFAFDLYDLDGTGVIRYGELKQIIEQNFRGQSVAAKKKVVNRIKGLLGGGNVDENSTVDFQHFQVLYKQFPNMWYSSHVLYDNITLFAQPASRIIKANPTLWSTPSKRRELRATRGNTGLTVNVGGGGRGGGGDGAAQTPDAKTPDAKRKENMFAWLRSPSMGGLLTPSKRKLVDGSRRSLFENFPSPSFRRKPGGSQYQNNGGAPRNGAGKQVHPLVVEDFAGDDTSSKAGSPSVQKLAMSPLSSLSRKRLWEAIVGPPRQDNAARVPPVSADMHGLAYSNHLTLAAAQHRHAARR